MSYKIFVETDTGDVKGSLLSEKAEMKITLGKGYAFLSRCYKYGNYVSVDRDRAEQYEKIAARMYI